MEFAPNTVERLAELRNRLSSTRMQTRNQLKRFFADLRPRLAGARAVEAELARRMASRFNVFNYLRDDELGLSHVVADLLNPAGSHGQGTLFLRSFLELIEGRLTELGLEQLRIGLDARKEGSISVTTERAIQTGEPGMGPRRLDISVVFEETRAGPGSSCIAIENKPYADDGDGQVQAYLRWLAEKYDGRSLLIHLSPHGGRPAEHSLPAGVSTCGLATMSYTPVVTDSGDALDLRLDPPLTSWFARCAQVCEVDRLRWFLRDAEAFCHKRFGGTTMMPSEVDEIRKFVLESDDNMRTAIAVQAAWPQIRNEIVAQFLEKTKQRIKAELADSGLGQDLHLGSAFAGRSGGDGLWLSREKWLLPDSTTRPYVWLAHDSNEPRAWYWSVQLSPKTASGSFEDEKKCLRERLSKANLMRDQQSDSQNFPWFCYLEGDFADWSPLVHRMHEETGESGQLVADLSLQFVQLARSAVRVIDEALGV